MITLPAKWLAEVDKVKIKNSEALLLGVSE
jgi:hypothetical protein